MKIEELKKLRDEADKLVELGERGIRERDCAECNTQIDFSRIKSEQWERGWKKGDLCFMCLRKWFDNASPKVVSKLVQEEIYRVFADDEQKQLGGEW